MVVVIASMAISCGGAPESGSDAGDAVYVDTLEDTAADSDLHGGDSGQEIGQDPGGADLAGEIHPDASLDSVGDTDAATIEPDTFQVLDLADPGDINAMWGDMNHSLWAVGADGLVMVWRRGEFVPGPLPPVSVDFKGITGIEDSIFIVGESGTVLRFRGGAWEDMQAPVDDDLYSISCATVDECFAVGENGTIVHLFEDEWDVQESGVSWDLYGVLSEVNGGTWVVGEFGSLFELSGIDWISSQIAGTRSTIRSICRGPDGDLFAVGTRGTIVRKPAGSSTWQQQVSNDGHEPQRDLYSVTALESGDVWVVGSGGAIIRYDGTYWRLAEVAGPVNSLADFRTVFPASGLADREGASFDSIFAAGLASAVVASDGGSWFDVPAGVVSDLNGVWVRESSGKGDDETDSVVFVGPAGFVLEYRDGRFGFVESGLESDLLAIDGGVAVGGQGLVALLDVSDPDGRWTVQRIVSSTVEDLIDVHAWAGGWVMVGTDGSVFEMDDELTPRFVGQVSGKPTSVVRTSEGLFVGGESGLLAFSPVDAGEYTGFSDVVTFTQSAIRDLSVMDNGGVFVVGDNGIMLVCGVQKCDRVGEAPSSFLYGTTSVEIDGVMSNVSVGWAGEVVVFDQESTRWIDTGTWKVFLTVDAGPEPGGRLFIGGRDGSVAILGLE